MFSTHWRRRSAIGALLALVAALGSGLAFAEEHLVDAQGQAVVPGAAVRILSLGPDVTEIVFALGGADRVVGVDRSSKYPAEAAQKPEIGYRRTLAPEGVIGLEPDLILASQDIGPPETVDVLMSLSVPLVFVPQDNSAEGIARKIDTIAAVLDRKAEGEVLKQAVLADFAAASALGESVPEGERKKVVFFHGLLRLTGAGAETSADAIIKAAGGLNPLDVYQGYKSVSEENLLTLRPDVVVMLSNGKGGPTPEDVFAVPALAETPAGHNKALIVLEGAYMIGFGPRTAEAVRNLAVALYPERFGAD